MNALLVLFVSFLSFSSADKTFGIKSPEIALKKILILGDSLTEGYGVEKSQAFPAQLENLLKAGGYSYKVLAAGTSGSTSASALKRLKWHMRAKPDVLILALGGNDGLRGIKPEATRENLEKTILLAKKEGLKIFLASMKTPTNYGEEYRTKFETTYLSLSKKHKVYLIPFILEGVATVKELNLADGIHPNESGHKVVADNIYKSLKDKL